MSETLAESRAGRRDEGERDDAALIVAVDCQRPVRPPVRIGLAGLREVIVGRGDAQAVDRDGPVARISIDDGRMSSVHARLERSAGRWKVRDAGSKNGTTVDGTRIGTAGLSDDAIIETGRTLLYFQARAGGETGERTAALDDQLDTFCGPLRDELDRLDRVARSDVPILLLGETGTGKEIAARAVHERSGRTGPFVAINCGALPASLVESELFGSEPGAFTGASERRDGVVRGAHGGTLFLDEIAELPPTAQAALLRTLQEREVRPLGSARAIPVDVRVVAATLRDLPGELLSGAFRDDLYARIAGLVVRLPPLHQRRPDLGALIARLLQRAAAPVPALDRAAARALFAYAWPHNIRELDNALRTGAALAGDGAIELDHLPAPVRDALASTDAPPPGTTDRELAERLADLLAQNRGNVAAVARAMGRAPMQIYRWMKRLGIDPETYRP